MILVTVGTNEAPFDRLLRAIDELALDEPLVVQYGASAVRPRGARCHDFLPYDDLVELIRESRVLVTHAGVGSMMTALVAGRVPVVVPRLARHREAVDDHQLTFARAVEPTGLLRLVEEPSELGSALTATAPSERLPLGPARQLVEELRGFIAASTGARRTSG